jgi:hypothetical protein
MTMKLNVLAAAFLLTIGAVNAQTKATKTSPSTKSAQETKTTEGAKTAITDEDLRKYAITMDSIKGMQATLQEILAQMVRENKVMKVQRYNELFKLADNEAKLTEAQATAEEKQFLKDVAEKRKEETARINATYQGLAKDYVGLKAFNTIRKSLETDQELKAKYESISKEVESKGGE